ncbi:hypothetical protein GGP41_009107 [Bipolaris sorokiniana]|uniref:Uncharacterized protein n=1 Tax=Cochliobolus sativus TaxID=45130 RepID=A0A8H5ZEQ8_COCSA|nr:hypothetical protein GGP41_009107 [Bipolaris sorokiniana]
MTNARCPRRPHALISLLLSPDDPAPCVGNISARVTRSKRRCCAVEERAPMLVGSDCLPETMACPAKAESYCTGTVLGTDGRRG